MKILIADDEKLARQRLTSMINELEDEVSVVGEAQNGCEVIHKWGATLADVVLLDIRMPEMDGLETARVLARVTAPPVIIFTTAYDRYAMQAFEASALDYLLKPIRKDKLKNALTKAGVFSRAKWEGLQQALPENQQRSHICVQLHNELQLIPVKDILYFQAEQKYVTIKTLAKEYLIDESLKAFEDEFKDMFIRVHRNALASLMHIETMKKLADGRFIIRFHGLEQYLTVSRRLAVNVRACFKEFKLGAVQDNLIS